MKVPEYQRAVEQQGLPNVSQRIPTSQSDFVNYNALAISQAAQSLGHSLAEYGARQAEEADNARIKDAQNKFQQSINQRLYDPQNGALTTQGEHAFKPDDSGMNVSQRVLTDLQNHQDELTADLSNDRQRVHFQEWANNMRNHVDQTLMQHEGQQFRVYQDNVDKTDIATRQQTISLNSNNHDLISSNIDAIRATSVGMAKRKGLDSQSGEMMAQQHISDALKQALSSSIQNGDTQNAMMLIDKYGDHFDAHDLANVKATTADNYVADLVENNPGQALVDLKGESGWKAHIPESTRTQYVPRVKQYMAQGMSLKDAILKAEGGSDTFDGNGNPAVSSDGKSIGKYQVTDDTARAPGFGIQPAQSRTHAEYNRVGSELMDALVAKYHGDPDKVAAAYNAGSGAVDKAIAKTGTPIDYLSNTKRLTWINKANAQLEHGRNVFKSSLENTIKDQYAVASQTGKPGDLQPYSSFEQAYGDKAPQAYEEYQDGINFQQNVFAMNTLPVNDAMQLIENSKVSQDTPNAARESRQHELLVAAFNAVDRTRKADPMAWALSNGYQSKGINWGNENQAIEEVRNRAAISRQMSESYGTAPALLTKKESEALSIQLQEGSEDDQVRILSGLRNGLQNDSDYHAMVHQLRPDSPATKIAGHIIGLTAFSDGAAINGTDAAKMILRGEKILNPSKQDGKENGKGAGFKLPTDLNQSFYESIGGALGGDMQTEASVLQAVRAYYASKVDKTDLKATDESLLNEAMTAVTGGIYEHAGEKVIPPYGVSEGAFLNVAFSQFQNQTGGTMKDFNSMPLVPVGPGQYMLKSGTKFYAGKNGPVVIDFN